MKYKVLFTWQSENKVAQKSLKKAVNCSIEKIRSEGYDIEYIYFPCENISGSPAIFNSLSKNISNCDVAIIDLSKCGSIEGRSHFNDNVCIELGMLLSSHSYDSRRIIILCDDIENAPFDISHLRLTKYSIQSGNAIIAGKNLEEELSSYIRSALLYSTDLRKFAAYHNRCLFCMKHKSTCFLSIIEDNDKYTIVCNMCSDILKSVNYRHSEFSVAYGTKDDISDLYNQLISDGIYTSTTSQAIKFFKEYNRLTEEQMTNGVPNPFYFLNARSRSLSNTLNEEPLDESQLNDVNQYELLNNIFSIKKNMTSINPDEYENIDCLSGIFNNIMLHKSFDRANRDDNLIIYIITGVNMTNSPLEYYFMWLVKLKDHLDMFTISELSSISVKICSLCHHNIDFMKSSNFIKSILYDISYHCSIHYHTSRNVDNEIKALMYKTYTIAYSVSSDCVKHSLIELLFHKQIVDDCLKKTVIQIIELGECLSNERYNDIYSI